MDKIYLGITSNCFLEAIKEKAMFTIKHTVSLTLLVLLAGCNNINHTSNYSAIEKVATSKTLEHQILVKQSLPFNDDLDFELAEKGLIKRPEQLEILDDNGNVVWELGNYDFLTNQAYHSKINPSLERQAHLTNMAVFWRKDNWTS
jgi:alkyl sulfatase BDS1-like metallo-beta-lactamase superfamily hydrolase